MTTAVKLMIESRPIGLACPRLRGTVAARVALATFPHTAATVRHPGRQFAAPWPGVRDLCTYVRSLLLPSPQIERQSKHIDRRVVQRFSPIHF
jgi:hypothetical protein